MRYFNPKVMASLAAAALQKLPRFERRDDFCFSGGGFGDFCSPKNDTKGSRSPTLYGLVAVPGCSKSILMCCHFF